jgi:hypothetical protein
VIATLGHPRLVSLQFDGTTDGIWEGLARHGRPVQYAHVPDALALWDTWTAIAGPPVAFEPPSAGFVLTWRLLDALQRRGVRFTTLTHAAGLSSTGDPFLDSRLPFDEAYEIPRATARLVNRAKVHRRRIVAIGDDKEQKKAAPKAEAAAKDAAPAKGPKDQPKPAITPDEGSGDVAGKPTPNPAPNDQAAAGAEKPAKKAAAGKKTATSGKANAPASTKNAAPAKSATKKSPKAK